MEAKVRRVGLKELNEFEIKIKIDGAEITEELNRKDLIEFACGILNDVTPYTDDEKEILPDVIKEYFPYAYKEIINNIEE